MKKAKRIEPEQVELMGMAEAADLLGVSRQRVAQLIKENPRFPKPLAILRCGTVLCGVSVREFKKEKRPNGRPPVKREATKKEEGEK